MRQAADVSIVYSFSWLLLPSHQRFIEIFIAQTQGGGKETLGFFKDKINDGIEADVIKFFEANQLEFRQENSILADYYKTTNQKYDVRCQVRSDSSTIIDLTLCVSTKEQAEAICNNWKNQNEDVYAYLMDMLLK